MSKLLIFIPIVIIIVFVFVSNNKSKPMPTPSNINTQKIDFTGEKGQTVNSNNNQITISTADFETNKVKFFNTTLTDGKTVYYLVLKDKDGNFRAAANANKQCAIYGKGYRQVGDQIECLTCNKKYPVTDFAIEKPDCNPYPINAKLPINNGQLIISSSELESIASLF